MALPPTYYGLNKFSPQYPGLVDYWPTVGLANGGPLYFSYPNLVGASSLNLYLPLNTSDSEMGSVFVNSGFYSTSSSAKIMTLSFPIEIEFWVRFYGVNNSTNTFLAGFSGEGTPVEKYWLSLSSSPFSGFNTFTITHTNGSGITTSLLSPNVAINDLDYYLIRLTSYANNSHDIFLNGVSILSTPFHQPLLGTTNFKSFSLGSTVYPSAVSSNGFLYAHPRIRQGTVSTLQSGLEAYNMATRWDLLQLTGDVKVNFIPDALVYDFTSSAVVGLTPGLEFVSADYIYSDAGVSVVLEENSFISSELNITDAFVDLELSTSGHVQAEYVYNSFVSLFLEEEHDIYVNFNYNSYLLVEIDPFSISEITDRFYDGVSDITLSISSEVSSFYSFLYEGNSQIDLDPNHVFGYLYFGDVGLSLDGTLRTVYLPFFLEWDVRERVFISFSLEWGVEPLPLYYYNIEGACLSPIMGTNPAFAGISGLLGTDGACGDKKMFFTTIAASSTKDLCKRMKKSFTESGFIWPIKKVVKNNRPIYEDVARLLESQGYSFLPPQTEIDICEIKECFDFCYEDFVSSGSTGAGKEKAIFYIDGDVKINIESRTFSSDFYGYGAQAEVIVRPSAQAMVSLFYSGGD